MTAHGALEQTARRAIAAARQQGRPQWLVWRRPSRAGDLVGELDPDAADAFVYEVPEEGLALTSCGAAACIEAEGPDRFRSVEEAARALARDLHVAGDTGAPPEAGPLFVGGFAFGNAPPAARSWAGFPPARFLLPRVLHARRGEHAWCCVAQRVTPQDDALEITRAVERGAAAKVARAAHPIRSHPDPGALWLRPASSAAAHRALVRRALEVIHGGELEKVVIARALDVERELPFEALSLLRTLRERHPTCASFGVRRGDAWLAGATPERLLRRRGAQALAMALAGSAPRGRSPEEDARLRRALVESKKEQAEHAIVVRAIRRALEPVCDEIHAPEAPRVLALDGVQHLWTPLRGTLREPRGLLELAGLVHPTPAVAGAPRGAALAWLDEHEELERGWYAGLVGWVTPEGVGELSLALRCGLLRGGRARLFAGSGIVEGSLPEAEVAETRLKWNALLPPLLEL